MSKIFEKWKYLTNSKLKKNKKKLAENKGNEALFS